MMLRALLLVLCLGLAPALTPAWAAESPAVTSARATVTLVSDTDAAAPGAPYRLGLRFRLAEGWHIYTQTPGDAGLPPELEWTLPSGTTTGAIVWPAAHKFSEGPLTTFGYTGDVLLAVPATGPGPIRLHATWLICKNICVPEEGEFTLAMASGPATPSAEAPLFATVQATSPAPATPFWQAILLALLGGLVLNLMPCVFPVLAMKAMAIARLSGQHRDAARGQAAGYTIGVVASFTLIGGAVLLLRTLGHAVGWGFQFQSPIFVAVMAWVLFAIGLNLSGVFDVTSRFAGAGQNLTLRSGWTGSLFSGVLAVLVATPCTAPFMSVALAAALVSPPAETMALFVALGIGLAAPAAFLTLLPATARLLPRPGRWMDILKQALAFPMYAACAWLVWVLSLQSGADGVLAAGAGLVAVGFAAWVLRFGRRLGPSLALAACLGAAALLPGLSAAQPAARAEAGERFSTARLDSLRADGKPVFINMTAAWCVTCIVNDRIALSATPVQQAFAARGVTILVGDWTRQDPEISAFLKARGRDGVPLYLYYPPGGRDAVELPQILTQATVLDALTL